MDAAPVVVLFRFKIGDLVVSRAAVNAYRFDLELNGPAKTDRYDRALAPNSDVIVGRVVEECHGGVQAHYRVNRISEGRQILLTVADFEIEAWETAADVFRQMFPTKISPWAGSADDLLMRAASVLAAKGP